MTGTDKTIEQIRFLAENWKYFSASTRARILVTVWWYVKIRRPIKRWFRHLCRGASHPQVLIWLPILLLFGVSAVGFAYSHGGYQSQISASYALLSAILGASLGLAQSSR